MQPEERLQVRCKACGEAFDVPEQIDRATFEDPSNALSEKTYQCNHCSALNSYDKMDHFFGRSL
jgi:phage terminase large subunit GpA-like protein